jgi:hypothetical protein
VIREAIIIGRVMCPPSSSSFLSPKKSKRYQNKEITQRNIYLYKEIHREREKGREEEKRGFHPSLSS